MNWIKRGVIIKLSGGLGNQMFQFYSASIVANKRNLPLLLDLSWFNKNYSNNELITSRKFELDCFSLSKSFQFVQINELFKIYLTFFSTKVKNLNDLLSLNNKKFSDLIFIDYHCCDVEVDAYQFKNIFRWNENLFSDQLLLERRQLKVSNFVGVFLRKDDWMRLSPESVVLEDCFEVEILNFHPNENLVVAQIGEEPIVFNNLNVAKIYKGDCDTGWVSFEKMYLLSAMRFLYTSNSTYGRCAMYLTETGEGRIVLPCRK